jgi:hypothetical protein
LLRSWGYLKKIFCFFVVCAFFHHFSKKSFDFEMPFWLWQGQRAALMNIETMSLKSVQLVKISLQSSDLYVVYFFEKIPFETFLHSKKIFHILCSNHSQGSMLWSQFSAIFANFRRKIGFFLVNQCYDHILQKLAVVWAKNAKMFAKIFGENI